MQLKGSVGLPGPLGYVALAKGLSVVGQALPVVGVVELRPTGRGSLKSQIFVTQLRGAA